ncbi:MAG: hypothetical protein IJU96_04010 [Clostridia bacterium]|nr:hypothetical protein [Clostridia bacterium]
MTDTRETMLDIKEAMAKIYASLALTMKEAGFTPVIPEGTAKGEAPVGTGDNDLGYRLAYTSENGAIRLDYFDKRLTFLLSETVDDSGEFVDYKTVSVSLLDPETCDETDVSSISGEVSDTVMAKYCKPTSAPKVKAPKTVSKAAARSGQVFYDANTLANRLTASLYPEYREAYNANINKYGEFLPEEFFAQGCGAAVLATIKENNPARMKKLFNLLNEIYLDATNETQSLIVVTLLGQMNNDQELLANCVDYMCDDMTAPVIRVNKYLASSAGKKAVEQLKNPPPYKPKKAKKSGGLMARLTGMSDQNR